MKWQSERVFHPAFDGIDDDRINAHAQTRLSLVDLLRQPETGWIVAATKQKSSVN